MLVLQRVRGMVMVAGHVWLFCASGQGCFGRSLMKGTREAELQMERAGKHFWPRWWRLLRVPSRRVRGSRRDKGVRRVVAAGLEGPLGAKSPCP